MTDELRVVSMSGTRAYSGVAHSVFALAVMLPPAGSRHLRRHLHDQIKAAILDGRLAPGLQLPASRQLAKELGLSRNTVVSIYDLLLSEGYIEGRPGAGTFVAASVPRDRVRHDVSGGTDRARHLAADWRGAAPILRPPERPIDFDLRLGTPDQTEFPFGTWRTLSNRALRNLARSEIGYLDPAGHPPLREAIARHVSFARAVACSGQDVIVTAGAQQAVDFLARILTTRGRTVVALEDPGYPPSRAAFAAAGAILRSTRVDAEGLVVEDLEPDTQVICVTPSHQFPLGVAMSPRRRADLLDFAAANDALIIEDDYDGEFHFRGRPLDALQTLDKQGRVFYVGTFSKSLTPALRLGFVVAPAWSHGALLSAKQLSDWHAPALSQDTLAAFIAEGHLARHVRRMRKIYNARRVALLGAIEAEGRGWLIPIPAEAGLHVSADLHRDFSADAVSAEAGRHGIAVESLGRYAFGLARVNSLGFGFGRVGVESISPAIVRLVQVLAKVSGAS